MFIQNNLIKQIMSRSQFKTILKPTDWLGYMDAIVLHKQKTGKDGTAALYRATRNRYALFCKTEKVSAQLLDSSMLHSFRDHLQSNKLGVNSVNNYLSILRAVYNKGVEEQLIQPDVCRFNKLKLHSVSTYKRAVRMDVITEISRLELKEERLCFARDLFLFSFMACGIPFVDLVHLTRDNIHNNILVYKRTKTKTEIRITITPGMRYLIDNYSSKDSVYLFPVLKGDETYAQYKVALRTYNRRLNDIGNRLLVPVKLTSYVARHSWAMQAKEHNVPISVIGEALGHTSEKTTRFYLSNLDPSILEKANHKITTRLDKWIVNAKKRTDAYL